MVTPLPDVALDLTRLTSDASDRSIFREFEEVESELLNPILDSSAVGRHFAIALATHASKPGDYMLQSINRRMREDIDSRTDRVRQPRPQKLDGRTPVLAFGLL